MNDFLIKKIISQQRDIERLEVMQSNINNYVYETPYFTTEPGTITVSGTAVTGIGTSFTQTDQGKDLFFSPSAGMYTWIGRIATYISATSVTLDAYYYGLTVTNSLFHMMDSRPDPTPYFTTEPGTIAVSGTAVTGTGTSFAATDVGNDLFYSPSAGMYTWIGRIATYTSATSVTLAASYSGATITNSLFFMMYSRPDSNSYFTTEPGTIAVSGTAVTGTGTSFAATDVGNDLFYSPSAGMYTWIGRIATYTSATSVTLAASYTGATITNSLFHTAFNPGTILYPSALTLSRGTLNFTANVEQLITWQTLVRNTTSTTTQIPFSITVPTTQITIPQTGYYQISLYVSYSVNSTSAMRISINGQLATARIALTATQQLQSYHLMQYFTANDYFEVLLTFFTSSGSIQTNLEKNVNQSPFLYISRIS